MVAYIARVAYTARAGYTLKRRLAAGAAALVLALVVAVAPGPGALAHAQAVPVEIQVTFPQIVPFDLWHDEFPDVEAVHHEALHLDGIYAVNRAIRERALRIVSELAEVGNVWGRHQVHVDLDHLISVTMDYSAYMAPMAHPVHVRASVTADPRTGEIYALPDLFVDERYIDVLSHFVREGIEAQDIPLLVEFTSIGPDQEFFLTRDALVLYYQVYELAPYAWGFPEFAIPLYELEAIAAPGGPILQLLYGE